MRGVRRPWIGAAGRSIVSAFLCTSAVWGCSAEPPPTQAPMQNQALCLPGLQQACPCSNGVQGVQVCDMTGTAFSPCQCPAGAMPVAVPMAGASGAAAPRAGSTAVPIAGSTGIGVTGSGGAGAGGSGAGGAGGSMTPQPTTTLAGGIRIAEIAIYQAVKVPLAADGEPVIERNAPVIEGKEAFLRVFVEPTAGFQARDIEVELTLASQDGPAASQKKMQRVSAASTDAMLNSTINFDIPGEQITADLRWAVALREVGGAAASGMVDPAARFPKDVEALAALEPRNAGPLRVKVIPYRYAGDGSNRLPVMDQAQIDLFHNILHAYYPASEIELTMHEPVTYEGQVGPNTGWEQWLEFHCNLRMQEDPDPKELYYGIMSPRENLRAYGGGIIGISPLPSAASNYGRCSVGVGFQGNIAATTMAHELGHSLGLPHAPCGTSGGPYPYPEAKIGVWGYSLASKMLRDPGEYYDLMSYCDPSFISDFNFEKLFERIRYLNLQFKEVRSTEVARYTRVLIDRKGAPSVRGQLDVTRAPGGDDDLRQVRLFDRKGRDLGLVPAYYFAFSEEPSGTWLIPDGTPGAYAAAIEGVGTVVLR